jgi:hypothetical protein
MPRKSAPERGADADARHRRHWGRRQIGAHIARQRKFVLVTAAIFEMLFRHDHYGAKG